MAWSLSIGTKYYGRRELLGSHARAAGRSPRSFCVRANGGGATMRAAIALALVATTMLPAVGLALDDVAGWQGTRWGMNEDEVKATLQSDAVAVSPPRKYLKSYAPLAVATKIGAYQMEAVLQFDLETKKLEQVVISYPGADLSLWTTLADLLTEKYGAPKRTGPKLEWIFPTTTIELARISMPVLSQTSIRYYPSARRVDEKGKL